MFLCRSGEITYRIPRNRILYFASDRRQVTCVTTQRSFTFYGKLDQVAREVGPDFVRISGIWSGPGRWTGSPAAK